MLFADHSVTPLPGERWRVVTSDGWVFEGSRSFTDRKLEEWRALGPHDVWQRTGLSAPGNPRGSAPTADEEIEAAARVRALDIARELSPTDILDYVQRPDHRDHVSREYGLTAPVRKALDKILLGNPGHNPATGPAFASWRARQVRQAIRERERGELRAAREKVRTSKRSARSLVREIRAWCRAAKARVRQAQRDERARLRAELARIREALRTLRARYRSKLATVRKLCAGRMAGAKRRASAEHRAAVAELAQLRRDLAQLREEAKRQRARRAPTARELAQESDDRVRHNLPPELVPVFERVKHRIVGGPRRSRTEAFLQWAHDNPDEVIQIQAERGEELAAEDIAELQRQEAAEEASRKRKREAERRVNDPEARAAYQARQQAWRAEHARRYGHAMYGEVPF